MALSDYSDIVAWFSDEAGAEVFAKFVATEGIPCHITDTRPATHFEQHGVRVQRNRIDELSRILRLTCIAQATTSIAAHSVGRRLTHEGIPCCVAGEHRFPCATLSGRKEVGYSVAVPESFLSRALRLLQMALPPDAELSELPSRMLPGPEKIS